ncbi:D-ribose pyranase [Ruthenibacterium sp. TH_2024_36131]|uniref:D-ribose pyranase n=1 Tax=Owariibacterium komagatae TaxID=3136601 RepID=UPI0038B3F4AB
MFKTGIINPQINYHLSCLAHQDSVMISDAAMELPAYLNRVDLAYTPGIPEITSVVKGILKECIVEKAYMANEMKEYSPELFAIYSEIFAKEDIPVECIPHTEFCKLADKVSVAIRTGEFHYHYSSVILVSGCPY